METKKWYASKTVWTNAIALFAMIAQGQFGYVVDPSLQAYALVAVNFILRFVTKSGLEG